MPYTYTPAMMAQAILAIPTSTVEGACTILVSVETGSTVSATKDGQTYGGTEISTGQYQINVPEAGTYSITAIKGQKMGTATATVTQATASIVYFSATINVTSTSGATVTVTLNGNVVNTHTATGSPVAVDVSEAGTYTVTAVYNGSTATESIAITTDGQTASIVLNEFLPGGYTKLSYIEGTGTQYLDTGRYWTGNTKISITAQYTSTAYDGQIIGYGPSGIANYVAEISSSYSGFVSQIGASAYKNMGTKDTNKHTHILDIPNKMLYLDATSESVSNFPNPSGTDHTAYVLAFHRGSGAIEAGRAKVYEVKQYESGTLVMNLVPAKRDSDDKIGMYDTVNDTFLTNIGTGDFTGA